MLHWLTSPRWIPALMGVALMVGAPAMGSGAAEALGEAQGELAALETALDEIVDPVERARLEIQIARVRSLIGHANLTLAGDPVPDVHDLAQRLVRHDRQRDRLAEIRQMATERRYSSDEIAALLGHLVFDADRADAIVALYPAMIDPQNLSRVLRTLKFRHNRKAVAALLSP